MFTSGIEDWAINEIEKAIAAKNVKRFFITSCFEEEPSNIMLLKTLKNCIYPYVRVFYPFCTFVYNL
jgi:hypothetical protein